MNRSWDQKAAESDLSSYPYRLEVRGTPRSLTWRFEPRSEITSACAISHDVSEFFEGRRHIYGFRTRAFADAFERLNQTRVWTERDQAHMWKKSLVVSILLIAVIGGARLLLWYYEGR